MTRAYRLVALAAALVLVSACGNKGPLVLAQKPVPVPEAAPAAEPPVDTDVPAQDTPAPEQDVPATPPADDPAGGG